MAKEIQSDTYTPPPVLSNSPKYDLKKGYEPLEGGCTLPNLINKLLKKPLSIIHELEMKKNAGKITCLLLLIATVSFSVFGVIVGTFSWDDQIWAAPLKIVCGLLFSGVICLPSLYIFTCMGGLDAKFSTVSGMLCALIALSGLLLVGFAPVVWLFSVSSTSATFLGFLLIVLWLICACFGLSLVFRSACPGNDQYGPLRRLVPDLFVGHSPNDDNPSPHHRQRRKTGQLRGKEILSELLVRASDAGSQGG